MVWYEEGKDFGVCSGESRSLDSKDGRALGEELEARRAMPDLGWEADAVETGII